MAKEGKPSAAKNRPSSFSRFSRGNVATQTGHHISRDFLTSPLTLNSDDPEVMKIFVESRIRVQETFVREVERTRRTALWLAASLLGLACLVPVFAPEGRETISYILSAALFVFSAGAAGYGVVRIKGKEREIVAAVDPSSN